MYETGILSREQLGRCVVHVDGRLRPPHLLRYSIDGRAVGHVPLAPPGQLAHSASAVLVMLQRAAAARPLMYETGIESREQLGRCVVHVDVRLKHPRLLRYSIDGSAVGHAPPVPPGQLAHSASAVLVM